MKKSSNFKEIGFRLDYEENNLLQLPSFKNIDRSNILEEDHDRVNNSLDYDSVCRTALATLDLFKNIKDWRHYNIFIESIM